jgi:hypothetical protein
MNGGSNAGISATTADVGHGSIDVLIGGFGLFLEQSHSSQNLTPLAIATLRYLVLNPSLLYGMHFAFVCQAFNGDHLLASSN